MNSKNILLSKFRENQSNRINASDLRLLVNAIYSEMLLLENVLDTVEVSTTDQVASINQVSNLKKDIDALAIDLNFIKDILQDQGDTYNKTEIDAQFYTITDSRTVFAAINDVFTKTEIGAKYFTQDEIKRLTGSYDAKIKELEKENTSLRKEIQGIHGLLIKAGIEIGVA